MASLLHCRVEALICPYEAVVVNRESAYAATSVAVHPLYNITGLYNYIVDTSTKIIRMDRVNSRQEWGSYGIDSANAEGQILSAVARALLAATPTPRPGFY